MSTLYSFIFNRDQLKRQLKGFVVTVSITISLGLVLGTLHYLTQKNNLEKTSQATELIVGKSAELIGESLNQISNINPSPIQFSLGTISILGSISLGAICCYFAFYHNQ